MRRHLSPPLTVLFATAGACFPSGGCTSSAGPAGTRPATTPVEAAAATITSRDVQARIAFLANDALLGRDTPSPGLEAAAAYLESELEWLGLEPAGDSGSFRQVWQYREARLSPGVTRLHAGSGRRPDLIYREDFFVLPSRVDSVSGVPVYVGTAGGLSQGFPPEVRGRIAVVSLPPRTGMQLLRLPRAAAEAGAVGVLLVLPPLTDATAVQGAAAQALQWRAPVPTSGVRLEPPRRLLRTAAGESAASALLLETTAPVVFQGSALHLVAAAEERLHPVPNVVAILAGGDPLLARQHVVISAHFDHVGVGIPDALGDSIYNGADDNASGTAAVLEVAEAFAALPAPPRRTVVFLAVSGEEKGLLGSRHFVDHPTIPLADVVANINLDMVGRNSPDTVVVVGQEYSSLGPLAQEIVAGHPELGLTLIADPNPALQAFFRSDHVAFVREDVPAVFFTTWQHDDYHRPSDEADRIDTDKVARIARMAFLLTYRVADDPDPPGWLGDGRDRVREMLKATPF